jgi:hypothetical protein
MLHGQAYKAQRDVELTAAQTSQKLITPSQHIIPSQGTKLVIAYLSNNGGSYLAIGLPTDSIVS